MPTDTAACCDEAEDYETLRDAIAEAFNPSDDDVAEVAILIRAVEGARDFIARRPCLCTPDDIEDWRPCDRCQVLGRLGDKAMDRG
jgi:hypothetical protein